jgi:hypothetical protein
MALLNLVLGDGVGVGFGGMTVTMDSIVPAPLASREYAQVGEAAVEP